MIVRNLFLSFTLAAGWAFATDASLLKLVPGDAKMVAGLDCDRAKGSALGQRILSQMKDEDKGFQNFVESTGFDPRRDLREVLVVSNGDPKSDRTLVAVTGTFDQSKISAFLRSEGGIQSFYGGVEVWKNPKKEDGSVAILNRSLALFGKDSAVKAAIDKQNSGGSALPADLQARVNQWSVNDAWFVSTAAFTQMGVNADGKNKVMPGGIPVEAIQAAAAGVRFGSDLQVSAEALTRSDKDAQALVDVFRFVASMVRLNSDKPNADQLAKILDTMQLSTSGSTMRFSLTIPEEQFDNFFQQKNHGVRVKTVRNARNGNAL
ncbi:hypothetical protein [uncultured Paludibaculum sp.]|uniref:hypothetical protein n=1 Tax=uncultured Paludibaculum sp. TaxID=1765020 RepID=UPI002AAC0908|nr:hypothetical protein [uncultured Paludibaculum sp.]